jgi:t-SNARE complex subunit (syntaxin)
MEQLVTEQEEMVQNIEHRAEEVTENVDKAQAELGTAVDKAKSARRKKWWCLLIVRMFSPQVSFLLVLFRVFLSHCLFFCSYRGVS